MMNRRSQDNLEQGLAERQEEIRQRNNERNRAYYQRNAEQILQQKHAAASEARREKMKLYQRKYRENHPEIALVYREKANANNARYKARQDAKRHALLLNERDDSSEEHPKKRQRKQGQQYSQDRELTTLNISSSSNIFTRQQRSRSLAVTKTNTAKLATIAATTTTIPTTAPIITPPSTPVTAPTTITRLVNINVYQHPNISRHCLFGQPQESKADPIFLGLDGFIVDEAELSLKAKQETPQEVAQATVLPELGRFTLAELDLFPEKPGKTQEAQEVLACFPISDLETLEDADDFFAKTREVSFRKRF
jgi:hypothetical protein